MEDRKEDESKTTSYYILDFLSVRPFVAIILFIVGVLISIIEILTFLDTLINGSTQLLIFFGIVTALLTIIPTSFLIVIRFYQSQTRKTEKAIRRLKEKEKVFFSDVEANLTALIEEVK